MLKKWGGGGGGGAGGGLQHFSVSPRPLGFGLGTKEFGGKGLGVRVWGQGLTIKLYFITK